MCGKCSKRAIYFFLFSFLFLLLSCDLPNPWYARVSNIEGVPSTGTAGEPLTLTGTVTPSFATNKDIEWSLVSAGDTGASLSGNVLNATAEGTVVVKATIKDGAMEGMIIRRIFR